MDLAEAVGRAVAVETAADLARAGDLAGAGRVLDGTAEPVRSSVEVLDLRARVHAQAGEYAEADTCWARVQEVEPEHPGAAGGRETLAAIGAGGRRRPLLRPATLVAAAAVLVVVAVATGLAVGTSRPAPAAPTAAAPPTAAPTTAAPIDPATSAPAPIPAAPAADARLADLAARLAGPGVTVRQDAEAVTVLLDRAPFARSDRLTPAGTETLRALGGRLADLPVRTTITGYAVAVEGGPQSGGSVVALARALSAARELAAGGGPELTAYALVSADQQDRPFPEEDRNRTITLEVRPAP